MLQVDLAIAGVDQALLHAIEQNFGTLASASLQLRECGTRRARESWKTHAVGCHSCLISFARSSAEAYHDNQIEAGQTQQFTRSSCYKTQLKGGGFTF
eukprot:4971982-Amphidinium_carterae.1